MKAKDHFTHKGWFFMCPIYLNADDGDGMDVAARFECLEWWFSVQEVFFKIMVNCADSNTYICWMIQKYVTNYI